MKTAIKVVFSFRKVSKQTALVPKALEERRA